MTIDSAELKRLEALYGCRYVASKDGKGAFPITHEGTTVVEWLGRERRAYGHVEAPGKAIVNWCVYDENGFKLVYGHEAADVYGNRSRAYQVATRKVEYALGLRTNAESIYEALCDVVEEG